jgi:hypothetical protein
LNDQSGEQCRWPRSSFSSPSSRARSTSERSKCCQIETLSARFRQLGAKKHDSSHAKLGRSRKARDIRPRRARSAPEEPVYAWFLSSMQKLDPYSLPHDHHELIAMVVPRAIIILGNDDYGWLGDESGHKSTMAAIEVFKAMGVADHVGYDFTSSHSHCSAPATQVASVKAFVDRYLKGGTTAPDVAIKPPKSGFDLNYSAVID